jgi:vacuolar-type H+-ATPase subunit F/Vma7
MTTMKDFNIAIIGNKDQTALMRLAGVDTYESIDEGDHDLREKIRTALNEFSGDPSIGIIMIPENWMEHVTDIVQNIRRSKRATTIIIDFPGHFDPEKWDVKEYYKTYTKNLIGFNVEI